MEVSEDGFLEELLLLGRESWEMPTIDPPEMAAFFTAAATTSLSCGGGGGGGIRGGGGGGDFDANYYVHSTITTTSTNLNSDILPIINCSYYDHQCFTSSTTCSRSSCCCSIINNNNNSEMFYPTSNSIDTGSNYNSSSSSETLIIKKLEQPNYPNFNLQHHEDGSINEYNDNNNSNFPMMMISSEQNQNQNQIFQKQHSDSEQQHGVILSSDENGKGKEGKGNVNGTRIMGGGGVGSFCHTNNNINNSCTNSNISINCCNNNNKKKKKKVQSASGHQPSKNLMAERRRRKRLNDRLSMLRSVVPKISKMDRTSILGDTIDYMKELLDRITNVKQEIHDIDQLNTSTTIFNDSKPTITTTAAAAPPTSTAHHHAALLTNSNSNPNSNSTPRFDVERRNVDTRVQMCCSGKPGLLLSTLTTLEEALGLQIQHCVISCFNDFSLTASCSEEAGQRTLVSSEEIKQALFRNAGYGGRCL